MATADEMTPEQQQARIRATFGGDMPAPPKEIEYADGPGGGENTEADAVAVAKPPDIMQDGGGDNQPEAQGFQPAVQQQAPDREPKAPVQGGIDAGRRLIQERAQKRQAEREQRMVTAGNAPQRLRTNRPQGSFQPQVTFRNDVAGEQPPEGHDPPAQPPMANQPQAQPPQGGNQAAGMGKQIVGFAEAVTNELQQASNEIALLTRRIQELERWRLMREQG